LKKKVLIAQDFGIYKELIEDGKTGLLVKNDNKDWYKHMKRVIEDPEYRQELANNLHEFVKDRYEITNVTADRVEFYKSILQDRKVRNKEFAEAK
jgi:glycosyltransferase involved in cell wall biosynthesis